MSRQDRRHTDEAARRECRMNSNRFPSLLFGHNRTGRCKAACRNGSGLFAAPGADLTA
jgi:hypothetical protein